MTIPETIAQAHTNLALISAFFEKYPSLSDEQNFFSVNKTDKTPNIYLHDPALCGDVLGKTGWTREGGRYDTHYKWTQNLHGCRVVICEAEELPRPQDQTPVPPSFFPLLLK